jgi:hypothetical protein
MTQFRFRKLEHFLNTLSADFPHFFDRFEKGKGAYLNEGLGKGEPLLRNSSIGSASARSTIRKRSKSDT